MKRISENLNFHVQLICYLVIEKNFLNDKKAEIWLEFAARFPIWWIYEKFKVKLNIDPIKGRKKFGNYLFWFLRNRRNFVNHKWFCWVSGLEEQIERFFDFFGTSRIVGLDQWKNISKDWLDKRFSCNSQVIRFGSIECQESFKIDSQSKISIEVILGRSKKEKSVDHFFKTVVFHFLALFLYIDGI